MKGSGERSTFRRFVGLLSGQAGFIALIAVASFVITVIGILSAFYFKVIIDQIVPGALWRMLTTVSIGILGLYIIRTLLDAARYQLTLQLQQRIDIPLILGYFNHVIDLPMSFFGTRRAGEVITRFSDAAKIREALASATITVFVDTVMSIAGCVILAQQNMTLFLIAVVIAVCYVILGLVVLKPVEKLNDEVMENNAIVTSNFVESLNGAETVKTYNAQDYVKDRTDLSYVKYLRSVFRFGKWRNAQAVTAQALQLFGTVIILWVGAAAVLDGELTLGGLVVFYALLGYFLEPVQNLMGLQPQIQAAIVAARRLSDVLAVDTEDLNGTDEVPMPRVDQPIRLTDVTFRYGTRAPVLHDINMLIPQGTNIALVGESGSGKTTIAKLLMKFYLPESGEITIGDLPWTDISAQSLRERVSYVSQNTAFFSGTIADNLRLAKPDATPEEMTAACKRAQAHEFIEALPGRYQAHLDENAGNLSGGQRQRLAIARALLRNADMLILDEATSNIDSVSERAITDTLAGLGGVTRLVIAHRLSTVVAADLIYVLQAGRIVEIGDHKELIAKNGVYAGLWNAQHAEAPLVATNRPTWLPTDRWSAALGRGEVSA
jgi:ATP-binding cassette subfamily B protein